MATASPAADKVKPALHMFERGESLVAFVGLSVAGVFLATMAGWLWWAFHTQCKLSKTTNAEQVRVIGHSLSRSVEALLSADEISTLRRVVAEVGVRPNLRSCRVLLPDGQVVADSEPSRITVTNLPQTWSGHSPAYTEAIDKESVLMRWPLEATGRGSACLEVSAASDAFQTGLSAQTGLGVIAIASLCALLGVYRFARYRLRGIGAVRQALLATAAGERSIEALTIAPQFGIEAEAWNRLLREREQLRRSEVLGEARQTMKSWHGANGALGAACDGLPQGLMLVDRDRNVQYANGAASVLLQATSDQLVGADLGQFISDERILAPVGQAAAGPSYKRTIVELDQENSGHPGVLRFVIRPVRREDDGVAMVIIEDITQQRVAEEARNAFLARATHELRTPLTNIRLYVETALVEGEKSKQVRAKCLNVINEESRRLERMVSDILSVSEIEAGSFKVNRDDVHLETMLEQLRADYEPQAAQKHVKLTFNLPPKLPVIQGDRDKISLALHNLIGNALKYTLDDGQVTVNVNINDGLLAIDVADTGIGISEEDIPRLFEKFYRARDKRLAEIPGSGMGLAIAREVIRLHGGNIEVQSEVDKGSNFTLTLPVGAEAA